MTEQALPTIVQVINANSSTAMTAQLENECTNLVPENGQLVFTTNTKGPASIEGFSDGVTAAFALAQLIREIEQNPKQRPSAYVIACFDDTGLDAARELTDAPVIGIGEASCHVATLLGQRFIVMTSLARSISIIENNLDTYGLNKRCSGVFASGIPVLQLEQDPNAYSQVVDASRRALECTNAEVLVLGCAGMSRWVAKMEDDLGVPVIDGVRAGIKLATSLVELSLKTSKRLSYKQPEIKQTQ